MRHRSRLACALGLAALLSACGGGGSDAGAVGGGGGGFSPGGGATVDALAAWSNFLNPGATPGRSWTVSGVGSDNRAYTITISTVAGVASAFPVTGTSAARADTTVTTAADGVIVGTVQQSTFFNPNTLEVIGVSSTDGQALVCDVAGTPAVPPGAVTIPNSGALATLDARQGCQPGALSTGSSIELTWSVDAEPGIEFFCINSTERTPAGTVVSIEQDCVEVNPDGTLGTRARVTLEQSNVTVVARN